MKRLLALLGVWPLVWTRDHDGGVRLRVARLSPFGEWTCHPLVSCASVKLRWDGTVQGSYVANWKEWKYNVKHVKF